MPMTPEQRATLEDVTQFIYREARLQDEHCYDEWESLWTDDAIYWGPANGDDGDPEKVMSIIYDNRSRIGIRVRGAVIYKDVVTDGSGNYQLSYTPSLGLAGELVVWGAHDRYLGPELATPDPKWVPNQRVVRLHAASHWVQNERPAEVNQALLKFLAS